MPEAGKYGIVYADPPWRYDMKRGNGVAEKHYPTMSMEEICALPVADLAARDSALFLWAPSRSLMRRSVSWRHGASNIRPWLFCG